MGQFWLRTATFSLLWVLNIVYKSQYVPFSIIAFSVAMGIYFSLSIKKGLFSLYLLLSLIVLGHSILLTEDVRFSVLLLFCLSFDAALRLKERENIVYLFIHFLLLLFIMLYHEEILFELIFIYFLLIFQFVTMNRLHKESLQKSELYDQLLDEYRKIKRLNRIVEQDTRLEERNKIARDIHDSVGHRLTALMMKLEVLSIQQPKPEYEELKKMVRESLEETRQAVNAMQQEENEGIATIVQLIRKLEAESHLRVNFTLKQGVLSIPLSNEKNVVLYRVIQESLTNAMRHTQFREVHVTLGKTATGDLSFEIINPIFEPVPFSKGFGLTNMKERVENIKGMVHVYQTEKEFIVTGSIPSGVR